MFSRDHREFEKGRDWREEKNSKPFEESSAKED